MIGIHALITFLQLRKLRLQYAGANTILHLEPDQPDAYSLRSEARRRLGDTTAVFIMEYRGAGSAPCVEVPPPSPIPHLSENHYIFI